MIWWTILGNPAISRQSIVLYRFFFLSLRSQLTQMAHRANEIQKYCVTPGFFLVIFLFF